MQGIRDVVCGKSVDPTSGCVVGGYHGTPLYFCSEECRARFRVAPYEYARPRVRREM